MPPASPTSFAIATSSSTGARVPGMQRPSGNRWAFSRLIENPTAPSLQTGQLTERFVYFPALLSLLPAFTQRHKIALLMPYQRGDIQAGSSASIASDIRSCSSFPLLPATDHHSREQVSLLSRRCAPRCWHPHIWASMRMQVDEPRVAPSALISLVPLPETLPMSVIVSPLIAKSPV